MWYTCRAMNDRYESFICPLEGRYASEDMKRIFSPQRKFSTWRKLWLTLAECQQALGLDISDEQIAQLREHLEDIDFAKAAEYEKQFRHDVMAHVHALGDAAPLARPIIHLGATSQFVGCNTDLLLMRDGLKLIATRLANVIDRLGSFAQEYRDLPCLGYTHFQPAQPTTVGKRATLWCYDFVQDLRDVEYRLGSLELRSVKGTTGTQASFLALFDGDHEKVRKLERMIADRMGFEKIIPVTGQTYSRKVDAAIAQTLAGIAASAHKFANDIRLLAHRKEMEEPFGKSQIGSSAMAYKRNPMRCERMTALSRFLIDLAQSPVHTAAEQWFERTLDDSANKRLAMGEAFLAADAVLMIAGNVAGGLVVYPAVIEASLRAELPFMATENILMEAVRMGGDRQELHEKIRVHSQAAAENVKTRGQANDLIERLKADDAFAGINIDALLDPSEFVGRASQQVDDFLQQIVMPLREKYADRIGSQEDLKV